jgi:DNA-binding transcriptional ArsR family regulator
MSQNNTRRLVAVLLALLVACSFVGAPAVAAAGSDDSTGASDAFGSDGDSTGSSTGDDPLGSSGDSSDRSGEDSSGGSDEDSSNGSDGDSSGGSDEDSSNGSDGNGSTEGSNEDDSVENVTEPIGDVADETTTVDETVETAEDTTDETLELVGTAAGGQDDLDLQFDDTDGATGTEPTATEGEPRLSTRQTVRPSGNAGSDAGSAEYGSEGSGVDSDADEEAALSTGGGGGGGQPLPAGTSGGVALGLGALAAAAAVRSTPLVASSVDTRSTGLLSTLLDKVKPFVFPLRYSRYDDSDPLEHDARERVYEIINETPGSYLSEVSERAGLPLSTTRHHMKVLEREDFVSGAKLRGKRRFYPAYAEGIELAAALNDESTASIIDALTRLGASSVSDLADDLGRDPSTISHHLQRLEDDEVIAREREGRAVMNKLSAEARTALEPETTPKPGEAAGAVAD